MIQYPSISKDIVSGQQYYVFDKLDGSNIRVEWTRKNDFCKFGTRHRLLGEDEKPLGEAISLICNEYGPFLDEIFRKERYEKAVAFFEFYGEHSFAGFHEDEEHYVTLIDVHVHKKGILPPKEFIKLFGGKAEFMGKKMPFNLTIPRLLHIGNITQDFIQSVKDGTLEGMTFEGVVCKGKGKHHSPHMFKIKSNQWIEKLKDKYKDQPEKIQELM